MVEAFQAAHGIEELVIVADAGMLSAANLKSLDEAHLRFIVGARTTRAPGDLEAHFHWAGDAVLQRCLCVVQNTNATPSALFYRTPYAAP